MRYLIALSSVAFVWGSVVTFDNYSPIHTNVTNRYLDGTIEADVRRVQTNKNTGELNARAFDSNMRNIRNHAECSINPTGCKNTFAW